MTLNSHSGDPNSWTLTRARARFYELVERAQAGPQIITRNGEPVAVLVSAEEWARRPAREGTLAELLLDSPLRDTLIDIERVRDRPRDFEP